MSHSIPVLRAPSALTLLDVWEQGQDHAWVERALLLLAAACPDAPLDALAQLTIGQRDACLLTLREQMFGSALVSITHCPECSARSELDLRVNDLRAPMGDLETRLALADGERVIQFRLPNSYDLLALRDHDDPETLREYILARCAMDETLEDAAPRVSSEWIEMQMAQADPQAQIDLDLTCPECGHAWLASFDIVSYLWSELHQWATRALRDVHQLASAYGWSERAILETSPLRRQHYLDLTSAV